jgi:hypothetical protein
LALTKNEVVIGNDAEAEGKKSIHNYGGKSGWKIYLFAEYWAIPTDEQ